MRADPVHRRFKDSVADDNFADRRSFADRICKWTIEILLGAMVVAAPWGLGGTHPTVICALQIVASLLLLVWATRLLLSRTPCFRSDGVLAALGGLTLLTALQLVPVPESWLHHVSPHTLATNTSLRPAVRERLPDEIGPAVPRASAFPLSLSPPDTRDFFKQILLVTLIYAAARGNWTGPGPLIRLSWALVVNGALLGLLAVAQKLSSPPTMIYWSIPVENFVAGPFVNRNHLADYLTICLGLACALLAPRFRGGLGDIINRPSVLWLLAMIGAIGAGIAISQSRGGVMAILAAAAGSLLLWLSHSPRAGGLGWLLGAGLAVAAVGSWVGWSALSSRMGTIEGRSGDDPSRYELWVEGLEIFSRHPGFGTGNGTFDLVEPSYRTQPGGENLSSGYAHNEYVEALAEGGIVRFGLTLLLVSWPMTRLVRHHRRVSQTPGAEFVLAGFFGLLALSVHSFVDFGVHLPAIAMLVTAFLAALMSAIDQVPPAVPVRQRSLRGVSGLGLLVIAGLIGWDGFSAFRAEECRAATLGMTLEGPPSLAHSERAVRLMSAASDARPGNALYHHEVGQAYLARALNHPSRSPERVADLRNALRHWRLARDLCPIRSSTQARLGRYRDLFASADPALAYFERARSLLPTDATMIYYCGLARWEEGDIVGASAEWQHSLTNSPLHLADILAQARPRLDNDFILSDILPESPERILAAADLLFPADGKPPPARQSYLERARNLLSARADKTAADWELEGRLEAGLGHAELAVAAYRHAVGLAPLDTRLRMIYAQALHDSGALADARRELETVMAQEPANRVAQDRLDFVTREIQLGKKK